MIWILDVVTEPSCVTLACDDIQTHAHKIISKQISTALKKRITKKQKASSQKCTALKVFGRSFWSLPPPTPHFWHFWKIDTSPSVFKIPNLKLGHCPMLSRFSTLTPSLIIINLTPELLTHQRDSNTSPAQKSFYLGLQQYLHNF